MCAVGAARGESYGCVKLPTKPTAPPVIGDFSADGVADILVPTAHAVLGVRVATGVGGILRKLFICFLALAIALAVVAKYVKDLVWEGEEDGDGAADSGAEYSRAEYSRYDEVRSGRGKSE